MDLDFDLSPRAKEICQPHHPPCLQEFTKSEEIGSSFPRFIGVLNTMSDAHTDGYCPRKSAGLYQYFARLADTKYDVHANSRDENPVKKVHCLDLLHLQLVPVGSDAAELTNTSDGFFLSKAMESMNGQSNVAFCHVVKSTRLASTKPVNLCIEDQDYIGSINLVQDYLDKIKNIVKTGDSEDVLKAAVSAMEHVTDMLTSMSSSSALAHSRL